MENSNYYLREKYEIKTGSGRNIALCTCWTDTEELVEKNPDLKEKFAVIGSLYSKEGVSIILRNLCLNPEINYLFLWAKNELSQTAFGSAGWQVLKALWKYGVSDDNIVNSVGFQLHKEIDADVIRKVITNVQLIDVSDKPIGEVINEINNCADCNKYMENISFPETKRDTSKSLPSEEVGFTVRGNKVVDAWLKVVDKIVRYGIVKKTQYGNSQKELHVATWVIENEDLDNIFIPNWDEGLLKLVSLEKEAIKEYLNAFLDPKVPEGTAYTYGQRLRSYLNVHDQIMSLVDKVNEDNSTRRAVATTFYPPEDLKHKSPPCLTQIHILTTNDKRINMFAVFRSHDIFKASMPNAFSLLGVMKFITEKTGYKMGKLAITSNSAHIYEEEWEKAEELLKNEIWEKEALGFDENTDLDPRGNIRISLIDGEIIAEMFSHEGEQLFEFNSKTARDIVNKISKLDLLSKPYHYSDIAIELFKAEIALKNGLKFEQDKEINIGESRVR